MQTQYLGVAVWHVHLQQCAPTAFPPHWRSTICEKAAGAYKTFFYRLQCAFYLGVPRALLDFRRFFARLIVALFVTLSKELTFNRNSHYWYRMWRAFQWNCFRFKYKIRWFFKYVYPNFNVKLSFFKYVDSANFNFNILSSILRLFWLFWTNNQIQLFLI